MFGILNFEMSASGGAHANPKRDFVTEQTTSKLRKAVAGAEGEWSKEASRTAATAAAAAGLTEAAHRAAD